MHNYTNPPWFIGRLVQNGEMCIVGDHDSAICMFTDRAGPGVNADAALISAAPDLLRVLLLAREYLPEDLYNEANVAISNAISRD